MANGDFKTVSDLVNRFSAFMYNMIECRVNEIVQHGDDYWWEDYDPDIDEEPPCSALIRKARLDQLNYICESKEYKELIEYVKEDLPERHRLETL